MVRRSARPGRDEPMAPRATPDERRFAVSNRSLLLALITLLVVPLCAPAETIHLAVGAFDPLVESPQIDGWLRAEPPIPGETSYYLVQLDGPPTDARKSAVATAGAELIAYLPDNTYIARIDGGDVPAVESHGSVSWVGQYHPAYKMSPLIGTHEFKDPRRAADSFLTLMVRVFDDIDGTAKLIEAEGASIVETVDDGFQKLIVVRAAESIVPALARIRNVWWIEEKPEFYLMNDTTKWVVQSNATNQTPVWDKGLHGEGEIVAVMDSGIDYNSCWFRDGGATPGPSHRKVIDYSLYGGGLAYDGCDIGHGTHVCGTLAGDQSYVNPGNYDYNGMAYEAQLVMQDIGADDEWSCTSGSIQVPSSCAAAYTDAHNLGARIHSNSWGGTDNTYDSYCVTLDNFMWANPDFLIVFAAGNSGPSSSTVGFPGTAKNCLTVGATRRPPQQDTMAGYSSRGPAFDSRIKPTVVAPGGEAGYSYINSADNDMGNPPAQTCNVASSPFQGTSMATPCISGLAALTRQYFREGWYPYGTPTSGEEFSPSAALMKAMILASGTDMATQDIPNGNEGWGRALLDDVLYFEGDARELKVEDFAAGVSQGGEETFEFSIDNGTIPVEVVLVWTDYPATSGASVAIQNNLDLEVDCPGGVTFKGNVFLNGESVGSGSADSRNVEEVVLVKSAPLGTYTVRVKGTTVPHGPQPFAVVITGGIADWPPLTGIADAVVPDGRRVAITSVAPNPFNPMTEIAYALEPAPAGEARATLKIYSVDGRVVRTLVDRPQGPGRHTAVWHGRDDEGQVVASGIYFCELTYGGDREVRKLTLLK
ncbi:MAG: S8 family serine peptidase [Candidatus Eisenbacteria bacterium]|nr:S8 family serine peptidase [Candidatus Eisenbacteria bacterium]